MELSHLRYFTHVARARSFVAGARLAHVSPPAMTKAIRRLEDELGAALFERTTRRVALTAAGEVLLERCRELLALADDIPRSLAEQGDRVAGELRIGAMEVFSVHALPLALAKLVSDHPLLVPSTFEMTPDRMEQRLADGSLEVAFTIGGGSSRDVTYETLGSSPGVVVCGRTHPLYQRGRIGRRDLERHPFTAPRFLDREHLPPLDQFPDEVHSRTIGATIELLQMGIELVAAGTFLGYFPEISVRGHLRSGRLRRLRGLHSGAPFRLRMLTRARARVRPAVVALRAEVVRVLARG